MHENRWSKDGWWLREKSKVRQTNELSFVVIVVVVVVLKRLEIEQCQLIDVNYRWISLLNSDRMRDDEERRVDRLIR